MKFRLLIMFVCSLFLFVSACSGNNELSEVNENNMNENNSEPIASDTDEEDGEEERENVTLSVSIPDRIVSGDDWDHFQSAVENEFPHITLEHVSTPHFCEEELGNNIAADEVPDIMTFYEQRQLNCADNWGLAYDFEYLIDQYNHDISVYEPEIIESVRHYSPDNGIAGLPLSSSIFALHYNKEIFDNFGVSYPEAGMTWDDVVSLAGDLTREEDGALLQIHGTGGIKVLQPCGLIGQLWDEKKHYLTMM